MWLAFAGFAGIVVTGLVTWLVARRTNSGRVDQSPATVLWETMSTRLTAVEGNLAKAEAGWAASRQEVFAFQDEAARLRRDNERLRGLLAQAGLPDE